MKKGFEGDSLITYLYLIFESDTSHSHSYANKQDGSIKRAITPPNSNIPFIVIEVVCLYSHTYTLLNLS
ncbi:hypothetical protein E2C01_001009 [Portunus trituberculatus]|uniref:Uncharacterized protein n=1 Tax=Portunus trituberculatus TaxID=210409 RepID=A0A5B7CLF1_PORTR|nr:hypothetical protein [Portunus trituberculatus]